MLKHHKIIKFIISGGSAAVVEYGIFIILTHTLLPIVAASILSFSCGLFVSFALNKLWVFSSKKGGRRQFILYTLLAMLNMVLSTGVLFMLVEYMHVTAYIAKLLVMGMIAIWNYCLFSYLIFAPKKSDTDSSADV